MKVTGGFPVFGFPIGVLLLENTVPRIPGDIGNGYTFEFPVRHKVVRGATVDKVLQGQGEGLFELFLEGAHELVGEGVAGITTGCGFLAMFQKELAAQVPVPVFSSALMQIPLVYTMLKPDQKVGVITADSRYLSERHFQAVGAGHVPMVIEGGETEEPLTRVFLNAGQELDPAELRAAMLRIAGRMIERSPEIGAFVIECSQMPPYSRAVRDATGRPVFDLGTLIRWMHDAILPYTYPEPV